MKTSTIFKYALGILAVALLILPAKVAIGGLGLAAMTNFSSVDFDDEQIRELADVVMEEFADQPKMTEFHTVIEGIITGKQIVYAGLLEKITKANAGCGTGATSKAIPFTQKLWDPKKVKVWLEMCADELDQSLMIYAKKKGLNVDDLTGTEIESFLVDHIKPAMLEDAFRIIWFNDTDHSNVSDSGGTNEITDGVDVDDYNMIDGLWKQLIAITVADADRLVTISENSEANYADQLALGATTAKDVYKNLIVNAHPKLKKASDKKIISTMTLLENYADYLESQDLDASYVRLESGFTSLKRRGVTVIGWEFWDDTIQADFDNGTTYLMPHRAVLTTAKNLLVGLDDSAALQDLEIWYEKKDEKNNFRGKYKIDAKVAVDYMVQVAI